MVETRRGFRMALLWLGLAACAHPEPGRFPAGGRDPVAVAHELGRVLSEIESRYVEPVDRARLLSGAIRGMVAELDPHSSYMTREEYTKFLDDSHGMFGGIGVEVDLRHDKLIVIAPIEGSPAEAAGLRSGDSIVSVDGVALGSVPLDTFSRKLRGAPGTTVRLSILREGEREPRLFSIVRARIRVRSVLFHRFSTGDAYLRIKHFQRGTHDELLRAARNLLPARSLILDLRHNPGGLVDEAAEIADEFLNDGLVYTTRHRGAPDDEYRARRGGVFVDTPLIVLVNEWSASASELLAGALQDSKRATIVGARTFGKGSVQSIYPLDNGTGLRLTTSRYYTPNGRALQGVGITPDIVLVGHAAKVPPLREVDLDHALDPQATDLDAGAVVRFDGSTESPPDSRGLPAHPTEVRDPFLKEAFRILAGRAPVAGATSR